MLKKCMVTLEKKDPMIVKAISTYPTAWADILMDSVNNNEKVYEIKGYLQDVSGCRGMVSFDHGIILSVPLYAVRLLDE